MSKPTKRTALIDADILIYRAALTAEYTVYVDPEMGHAWRQKKLVPEDARDRLHSLTVVEGPQKAVDVLKSMLASCVHRTSCSHMSLFISPSKTFRHRVAKTLPYKGNRADRVKPVYYELLSKLLIAEYGAVVCDDIEADDALGIVQTAINELPGQSSVICSDDKDLKMIPGDHYNLRTHEQEIVTRKGANLQFCKQMLAGDMTDNIQGLTRVGLPTAAKMLNGVESKDRKSFIIEKYKKQFKDKGGSRFKENFKLLKILTKVPEDQSIEFYNKSKLYTELDLAGSDDETGFRTK